MIQITQLNNYSGRLCVHLMKHQVSERALLKENIPGILYHPQLKIWSVPFTKDTITKLKSVFGENCRFNFSIPSNIPDKYVINNKHTKSNKVFKKAKRITLKYENAIEALEHQIINAIKYFYIHVIGRNDFEVKIDRPKLPKDLPHHLTLKEVKSLLDVTHNLKHKAIIATIYSAGLRLNELVNLKLSDINSDQNFIRIQHGKGKKDRYTLLAAKLLVLLRKYYKIYKPQFYLFEGQLGGKYSKRSVQNIITNAVQKSSIFKATTHTLRHSLKELLGHSSIKTTEIYLHISQNDLKKINSPLQYLEI